jgi:hypothetical protein
LRAQWRAKKNKIKKLRIKEGIWCEDWKGMCELTRDFFQDLFTKDDLVELVLLMPLFEIRVSQEMNDLLCRDFIEEEIGVAWFQIGPLKAPGLDGFPTRFFQRN